MRATRSALKLTRRLTPFHVSAAYTRPVVDSEREQITNLLERHRSALHALPGVVGTAVGFRSPQRPDGEVVIQVFVRSDEVVDEVSERAAALVGADQVQVIVSGDAAPLDSAR